MNEKYVIIGGNKYDHLFQHGELVTTVSEYNFLVDAYLCRNARGIHSYVKKDHMKKESK
ncbi:hypothetical protein KoPa4_00051 [Pseudomonas phage vB_PpuM-KoPa-4]|uniref:Uncharacterized protein n=1 Tax=Pseudomonas phage vB_PpuM-KoPa-4 TaxID=3132618 RepID=A0AAX4MYR3_9CAUD